MANSIMGSNNIVGNNPVQMLQQFKQFRNQMSGQNPQQVVNQLIQSGQMSNDQFNSLMQQAQSIVGTQRR